MGLLDSEFGFINVLSDDIITLSPQGRSAAPAVSHQPARRRDAKGIFIHLSVSLFTCVAVATLIAIETYSRGSREERASCVDDLKILNKEEDVCIFIIVLLVVKGAPLVLKVVQGVVKELHGSFNPSNVT